MLRRTIASLVLVLSAVACSKSPTDPSESGGDSVVRGQTVNAIDGTVAPNLTVRIGTRSVTSDASGNFQIELGFGSNRATIRGSGVVERETRFSGSGGVTRVSMIPSNYDLDAFNQMFRNLNGQLSRWTSRPSLVVLGTVMDYRTVGETYEATGESMSDEEVSSMIGHLTEGLAFFTGGTYQTFASVNVERPAAGTRVNPFRPGTVVVGRYKGVFTFANTIGWGQWAVAADGTVSAGATFLDANFDRDDSRRRLLRIHELGHALGYQHVDSRTSIMNPAIGPEPTDFDRAGSLIAFQRPVGNRSPDVDPENATAASTAGALRWSNPTICR